MSKRYTEDDLRAAFTAKAGEAPKADDVLRAVRQAERPRQSRRRWLVPAVAAAALVAVAVPIALSGNGTSNKASSGKPAAGEGLSRGGAADTRSASSASLSGGASNKQAPEASSLACRPQDVTTTLTVTDATHATLVVTSRAGTCGISRIPRLRWANALAAPAATTPEPAATHERKGFTPSTGSLAAGASATAPITWQGCLPAAGTARVDWGAGPVDVAVTRTAQPSCDARHGSEAPGLTIGAFTGLR